MNFSHDSIYYIQYFLNNLKHSKRKDNNINKYIKVLYDDIHTSYQHIQKLKKKEKIKTSTINIDHVSQIPKPDSFTSKYFPEEIKNHIHKKSYKLITCNAKISGRDITIHLVCSDQSEIKSKYSKRLNKKYECYINKMLMWLSLAFQYSSKVCSETLDIYLYLTPFKKKLPESELVVLDAKQVNTAWTWACEKNGEIILFREEEWFKVFIHETFHNLGLDFANMNLQNLNTKLRKIFRIHGEINSFEAYCDFWARILNSAFTSYFLLDNKSSYNEFSLYCDFCFQLERMFTIFQCAKVLQYMNLLYSQLYETDISSIYKENTNVFSYYILTAVLMNDYTEFFSWCNKNNISLFQFKRTDQNLDLYYDYIRDHYKEPALLNIIDDYTNMIVRLNKNKTKNKKILETTRMSLIEYV